MASLATWTLGTTVVAADNFGPVIRGQLGMVTHCRQGTWLPWRRTTYDCTFLGGIHVTATRRQIIARHHGCNRQMLEDPWWFVHMRNVAEESQSFGADLRRPTP